MAKSDNDYISEALRDVLTAKGPIRNPTKEISEAIGLINEYTYRKEFGLSYEEYLNEPLESYINNTKIMSILSDIRKAELRNLKRQARK